MADTMFTTTPQGFLLLARAQLARLEAEYATLAPRMQQLEAQLTTLRAYLEACAPGDSATATPPPVTVIDMIVAILRQAGRPMQAHEIWPLLQAAGIGQHWKAPRDVISSFLCKPKFRRVARGLYTVREH